MGNQDVPKDEKLRVHRKYADALARFRTRLDEIITESPREGMILVSLFGDELMDLFRQWEQKAKEAVMEMAGSRN